MFVFAQFRSKRLVAWDSRDDLCEEILYVYMIDDCIDGLVLKYKHPGYFSLNMIGLEWR